MKQDCDRVRELLSPFLDGELAPEERELVEDHLIGCEACQKEFARLKELDQAISRIKVEEPSHNFHPRLIHTLSKEYAKRKRRRSFLIQLAPLAAAASILLIVLVSSQIFFVKYPTESFRIRSYEKGVEELRTETPPTAEGRDLRERKGVAGKAARGEITRPEGYVATAPEKERAKKAARPAEKPEVARSAEVPMAAKRGVISEPHTQTSFTPKASDELAKQKNLEIIAAEEDQAVAGAPEARVATTQRPEFARRLFDKTTKPRLTRTRNEFEVDVDSTDIVAQQLPKDQRVGIVVDLDSAGNVLQAELIKPTGSDTVDSAVIQNVRNQNFRTLTKGIEKFPSRQEIYYRFRQTGQ
ncbi:MAG TPA: hypothetical protein EYP58_00690 [bacterium (Candidatus Stahlbacteria)]|nr:hypothetical protein [Candidatus Stahlbacteria bacterium]